MPTSSGTPTVPATFSASKPDPTGPTTNQSASPSSRSETIQANPTSTQNSIAPTQPRSSGSPAVTPTLPGPVSVLAPAPTQVVPASPDTPTSLYIGETGHFIKEPFLAFWRKFGGYPVFGNPLSEPYTQNGVQVQLFEQTLLEYHPATSATASNSEATGQSGEISLGFLGRELAQAQKLSDTNPAFGPLNSQAASPAETFIPETGHTLAEPFRTFWVQNNLIKFLGYPISQAFEQDGLSVQYFERGRLEYSSTTKKVTYSNSGDLLIAAANWPEPQKFELFLNLPSNLATNQGQTMLVQLSNSTGWQPTDLEGKFGNSTLKFFTFKLPDKELTVLRAFQAIAPDLLPQTYPLSLTFTDKNGRSRTLTRSIQVAAHDYGTQDLILEGSLDALADHQADEYDDTQLAGAYSTFTPELLWEGLWHWPLRVPWTLTTDFAQRRVYNGKADTLYYHGGIDLAPNSGANGANVYTGAAGKVIYTGSLQARGLSVAVDHGLGITSYYFHLSQINVKVGQMLQEGDIVGLVGSTGRATGPHLDWEVRVNGIITDPRNFLQSDFSR